MGVDCSGPQYGAFLKRCSSFLTRAVNHANKELRAIGRKKSGADKSFFLNSYIGFAEYVGVSISLAPLPIPSPITPLIPRAAPKPKPQKYRRCSSCQVISRENYNVSRRLATAQNKLLRRAPLSNVSSKSVSSDLHERLAKTTSSNLQLAKQNERLRAKVADLTKSNAGLEEKIRFLENSREETAEKLADLSSDCVSLFDGRAFTQDTVTCVMGLSDCGVPDERVGEVIRIVAKLMGKSVDRVPSPSSVRNFALATLSIAKAHIRDRLGRAVEGGESICLLSDETNKLGAKYQLFGAGLLKADGGQEVFLFGLSQVADKSAQTAFTLLKERLDDLGGLGRGNCTDQFTDRFFAATTCTQSDMAATQSKFTSFVTDHKTRILPKVVAGWDEMSEEERERMRVVHVFYCQLHFIANLTNVVLEVMAEHERIVTGKEVPHLSPTVFTVVKEVARLFGDRSAGMHSCSIEYKAWCGSDLSNSSFPSFLGHRFNVVFLLGARIFCQREKLIRFIEECGGSKAELVRLAELLRLPLVITHLQILGMVDQLVTGPLWRLAENLGHVLDTKAHASLLLSWVRHCKEEPLAFFSGNCPVPSLQTITASGEQMLEELLSVPPSESSLEVTVLLMEASDRYFSHLFGDFIGDGRYAGEVSEDVVERTRCAPGTNRAIESGFGIVDRLHTHSPHMCVPRREAKLLISKNHSMAWLGSLPENERRELVSWARSSVPGIRAENSANRKRLAEQILARAHAREMERVVKKAAVSRRRFKAIEDVAATGIVTNSFALSSLLSPLSVPSRVKALIAQIRFRQRALLQEAPEEKFFVLSDKGRPLSEVELRRRLLVLINEDMKGALVARPFFSSLIGCKIRRWSDDTPEDGEVTAVETKGEIRLISVTFPSGTLSFPLARFECELDCGSFELLDEIL